MTDAALPLAFAELGAGVGIGSPPPAGWEALALGTRILRTETASLAALAVMQARWGDFRPSAGEA